MRFTYFFLMRRISLEFILGIALAAGCATTEDTNKPLATIKTDQERIVIGRTCKELGGETIARKGADQIHLREYESILPIGATLFMDRSLAPPNSFERGDGYVIIRETPWLAIPDPKRYEDWAGVLRIDKYTDSEINQIYKLLSRKSTIIYNDCSIVGKYNGHDLDKMVRAARIERDFIVSGPENEKNLAQFIDTLPFVRAPVEEPQWQATENPGEFRLLIDPNAPQTLEQQKRNARELILSGKETQGIYQDLKAKYPETYDLMRKLQAEN